MRKLFSILAILLIGFSAQAATEITAYVQITNTPAGLTTNITVNIGTADTRNWTNSASGAPSTSIQITNGRPQSVTNLIQHFSAFPVYSVGVGTPQALFQYSSTNTTNFTITAPLNTNITVSFGGNWATVFYVTNTYSDASPLLAPTNAMSARLRTNAENAIINLINQNKASNALAFGLRSLSNYIDIGTSQTGTNKAWITSTNRGGVIIAGRSLESTNVTLTTGTLTAVTIIGGTNNGFVGALTNGNFYSNVLNFARLTNTFAINGTIFSVTNGYWTNGTFDRPIATNLTVYGGFSAPGTNTAGQAYGPSSYALGVRSLAITADNVFATNTDSIAIGGDGNLSGGQRSIMLGWSTASQLDSIAIGDGANSLTVRSTAIGPGATVNTTLTNSVAIGYLATATDTNQIRLGTAAASVSVPGIMDVGTIKNVHGIGTNIMDGIFAFSNALTVASVAPGHNVIDSRTNTILYLTGAPGAAWVLGGFAGDKSDGRELEVWNQTGFDVTIQNESGTAPTASDRILTYATSGGTNATLTGNGLMKFRYSTTASRWLLAAPVVDIVASGTNGVNGISTNGATVTAAATGLNFIGNNNISVDQTTNTAGSVAIQFAPVLFRATNYGTVYNPGDWELLLNEEWIANPVSVAGAIGNHPWTTATAGTLPTSLVNPLVESNAWSIISMVTTQTTSGRTLACPSLGAAVPSGFVATNCEYFFEARLRFNSTNATGDVSTTRVGFGDSATVNNEYNNGIYIMNNTNVNTNTFILVTARNSVRTFNYSTIATYANQTWITVGWYLDRTGTNIIGFSGPDRFRFTSFATNNANNPADFATMGCVIQNDRMASTSGLFFRTNYCDYIKLWVRRFL